MDNVSADLAITAPGKPRLKGESRDGDTMGLLALPSASRKYFSDGGEFTIEGGVRCPGGVSLDAEEVLPSDMHAPPDSPCVRPEVPQPLRPDGTPSIDHDAPREAAVGDGCRGDAKVPVNKPLALLGDMAIIEGGSASA